MSRSLAMLHNLIMRVEAAPVALEAIRRWCVRQADRFALAFLVGFSGFLRFWQIATPGELVFDEIYFPVFAKNYLTGTTFFDSHPPLGKYLIAVGIKFFGFVPLGYRTMNALFGIGTIVLIYALCRILFKNRKIAFLAGLLAALDGLLLVESRTGLINIFAVFFSLAAYYLFLRSGTPRPQKAPWVYLAGAGICSGAAIAVKWIGVASLGMILLFSFLAQLNRHTTKLKAFLPQSLLLKRIGRLHPLTIIFCCALLPALVYAVTFPIHIEQNPEYQFVELHQQMYGYHANLKEGHGYASEWWRWPLSLRPVNYFWQVDETKQTVQTVLNIGNPVIWWLAVPAVMFSFWGGIFRRNFGVLFALAAFIFHYLPFALISRATFSYHYMGALPFAIILLAVALYQLWQREGWSREIAAVAMVCIVLTALYFYPIWTAYPIPLGSFYQRMWLASWV